MGFRTSGIFHKKSYITDGLQGAAKHSLLLLESSYKWGSYKWGSSVCAWACVVRVRACVRVRVRVCVVFNLILGRVISVFVFGYTVPPVAVFVSKWIDRLFISW